MNVRNLGRGALAALSMVALVSSCFRLDGFMFSPTHLTSYQLEQYQGLYSSEANALLPDSAIGSIVPATFTSGSETLYGYRMRHTVYSGVTILYNHGKDYALDMFWPRAKILYLTGHDVFLYDYRGFGMSTGTTTEASLYTDVEAAVAYLASVGVPGSEILVYGFSLGSVPATYAAAAIASLQTAVGLALEAPIGSAALFVQDGTELPLPADTVTSLVMDNAERIKSVKVPLLWMHGDQDRTNRWDSHGLAIYNNYGGTVKYKFIVPGAGHGDIPSMLGGTDFSVYLGIVSDFVAGAAPHL